MSSTAAINGSSHVGVTIPKDQLVGFSDITNQIYRKLVKQGFELTLMVAGMSGLGKSTLINSLFLTDIYSDEYPGPSKRVDKTVSIQSHKVMLVERGVRLSLTLVDTPGFGSSCSFENCWAPIKEYIEKQFEDYLVAETCVHRSHYNPDSRVHCCLYFIRPSGHHLDPWDIEFMQKLQNKVNIIPVIAKADTLTPEECQQFKQNIMQDIRNNGIKIYEFPDPDDGDENSKEIKRLKDRVPFAVAGGTHVAEVNGERKRGRQYPWGFVQVENIKHCDLVALRSMLLSHYMQDLIQTTHNVHCENYRAAKLAAITPDSSKIVKNPVAQMEEDRKKHDAKMKQLEQEMEQVLEKKVKEKTLKLQEKKAELENQHKQSVQAIEAERRELEAKLENYRKEKEAFDYVAREMEQQQLINSMETDSADHRSKTSSGSSFKNLKYWKK